MRIQFKEPPERKRGPGTPPSAKWSAIADALRARPFEWALVAENVANSMLTSIKEGRVASLRPPEHFEATSRQEGNGRGRCNIYVRYVGPR